ncbi:MAG: beta-lactamase family protein [Clostridiales Family XIII bacterium]|jgi:CubicO group peptidase (beta-lactamase class C family)|nr:beta-lactamase family protein [Clostridiales Family XIII bacterium]
MNCGEKIKEYINRAAFGYDLPGLAAGVYVGADSPLPCAGTDCEAVAGFMDFRERIPLRAEHVFHMASVSKLFVATGAMLLAERGLLDLEAPVCDSLPWFRMRDPRHREISALQLLTHTAGMPDVADYRWNAPETDGGALERYLRSDEVREATLLWSPREGRFCYSNLGYELLGALIAARAGRGFEEFMRESILRPLGMEDSTFLTFSRTPEGRAMDAHAAGSAEVARAALSIDALRDAGVCVPHGKDADKRIVREPFFPYNRAHGPSSTLTSNLRDMRRFGKAMLRGALLDSASHEKARKAYAVVPNNGERIGLAWFLREQNGCELCGHEGTDDGFRASFWICPELDLQITVVSNMSGAPVKKINKRLFELLVPPSGLAEAGKDAEGETFSRNA